jgi:hypothetical protein
VRHPAHLLACSVVLVLSTILPLRAAERDFALDLEGDPGTPFNVVCIATRGDGTQARLSYAGGPPRIHTFRAETARCVISKPPYYGSLDVRLLRDNAVIAKTRLPEGPGEATLDADGLPGE